MARPSKKFKANPKSTLVPWQLGICRRFKQVRVDNGLLQDEYAKTLGIKLSTLKHIEIGLFMPTIPLMRQLKKVYGTDYTWLIDGKKE